MPLPEPIKALIKSSKSNIHHLYLSNYGLNKNDMIELQELIQEKPALLIDSIDLSHNNICSEGVRILAMLRGRIKALNLAENDITDKGIEYLAEDKNSTLEYVNLADNTLTDKSAQLLLTEKNGRHPFKWVNLEHNRNIKAELIEKMRDVNNENIREKYSYLENMQSSIQDIFPTQSNRQSCLIL